MKKLILLLLCGLMICVSSYAQILPIAGTMGCCVGSVSDLTGMDSIRFTGSWSSSNPAIASVTGTGSTGAVTGISAGVTIITYSLAGSYVTASFTVTPAPASITGTTPTCVGISATLTDATTGGVWSSDNSYIATVSMAGVVTGLYGGTTDIRYTIGVGCSASIAVTIPPIYVSDSITGASSVCAGSTILLADAESGGVWSSSNTTIATVSAGGIVAGVSAGGTWISYTISSACSGSASVAQYVNVGGATSAGIISGTMSLTEGTTAYLSDYSSTSTSGTWSSSNTAIATVNPTTGEETGIAPGTTAITYSVSGCTGTATASATVTVTAIDGISGYINFAHGDHSSVKVWLITYDPATLLLEAIDSTTVTCYGSSVYYQFTGLATDSFRVKAALYDTLVSGTGYVPTYHTSSFYWHDADVIYYTSGTAAINENINMASGTVTTGPGFVGGLVTSGANRGTSPGAPVAGLLIFLQNSATGAIVQQTYTDASGSYSFNSLSYGTYFVYPELINYATTPYTSITLSAANPSVSTAGFIQHTKSLTITPVDEAVNNVKSTVTSVVAYPNPTNGKLNILWNTATTETGIVSITDITGREVYKSTIQMTAGSGMSQADLSGLTNGLYLISIKSANVTYNNKIEIQH